MKITDLSGKIKKGIWTYYDDSYPKFSPQHIMVGDNTYFCEIFHGTGSHTGTYLETVAHFNGYENQPMLEDMPLERMVNIPCHILKLPHKPSCIGNQAAMEKEDFEKAVSGMNINPGDSVLFCCGWSDWESDQFLDGGPYLTREAMQFLLEFKPGIIGSDLPAWENGQGVFEIYSKTDTLLLAPLVNLEDLPPFGHLTVLPVNFASTCCAPCRAVFTEDN